MNIETFFTSIPDFRRGQGLRFELSPLLWMIFLGFIDTFWVNAPRYTYKYL